MNPLKWLGLRLVREESVRRQCADVAKLRFSARTAAEAARQERVNAVRAARTEAGEARRRVEADRDRFAAQAKAAEAEATTLRAAVEQRDADHALVLKAAQDAHAACRAELTRAGESHKTLRTRLDEAYQARDAAEQRAGVLADASVRADMAERRAADAEEQFQTLHREYVRLRTAVDAFRTEFLTEAVERFKSHGLFGGWEIRTDPAAEGADRTEIVCDGPPVPDPTPCVCAFPRPAPVPGGDALRPATPDDLAVGQILWIHGDPCRLLSAPELLGEEGGAPAGWFGYRLHVITRTLSGEASGEVEVVAPLDAISVAVTPGPAPSAVPGPRLHRADCPQCGGMGKIDNNTWKDWATCLQCGGTGKIASPECSPETAAETQTRLDPDDHNGSSR